MEFDFTAMTYRETYKLISGCLIPRPIAWVSTQDSSGINNLAPFSFFNGVSSSPPTLSLAIAYNAQREQGHKDTLHNIMEMREFVVCIVTEATAEAMAITAGDHAPDVDEFTIAGVTPIPSIAVRPPRVAESPVCFECVLHDTMQIGEGKGSSTLVVGTIKHLYVRDDVIDDERSIDVQTMQPIGRIGTSYCYVRETFNIAPK